MDKDPADLEGDGKLYQVPELREDQMLVLVAPEDMFDEDDLESIDRSIKDDDISAFMVSDEVTMMVANKDDVELTSEGKVSINIAGQEEN